MKFVALQSRQATIGITLDTYSHLLPGMGRTATERFDKLLRPWLDEKDVGKRRGFRYAPRGIRTHDPRFRSLGDSVLKGHFTFKLERLCQLPKTSFVCRIPVSYIAFRSV